MQLGSKFGPLDCHIKPISLILYIDMVCLTLYDTIISLFLRASF